MRTKEQKLKTTKIINNKPKVVNHGNVFGTQNWYTFYCNHCGNQVINGYEKCEGSNPFVKGCGAEIDWNK